MLGRWYLRGSTGVEELADMSELLVLSDDFLTFMYKVLFCLQYFFPYFRRRLVFC